MPCNGFSLAVLIGCEPDHIGTAYSFLKFIDQFTFVFRYLVLRLIVVLNIDAHILFCQVANMSITGFYFIVAAKKFFYRLDFIWRLYYYKVLHLCFLGCFSITKLRAVCGRR